MSIAGVENFLSFPPQLYIVHDEKSIIKKSDVSVEKKQLLYKKCNKKIIKMSQ